MKKNILFFILFIPLQIPAWANFANGNAVIPHNFVEIGYGTGSVNSRMTKAAILIEGGYNKTILKGRICRSTSDQYRGYIFENTFLLGYRLGLGRFFNTTLSGGYSYLSFEKGYHTYFKAPSDKFNKTNGFSLEAETEWKISSANRISPFSLGIIYYTTFNSIINLNGFFVALKFCPERYKEHWYTVK